MAKTRDALSVEHGPSRRGLQVRRLFTTKGTHPYDELTWERRDAVITNWRDGTTAFEQRDLEFPSSWSQNATNIVAQKYFRGPLGTPQREHSVRQMVDRVAGTITAWGGADGYFAGDDDAEAFRAELTHLLVHQKAAFNSPVWFNVGVEPEPQCSACFILSVEDTMPSILNWYVEEGMIFKGGSGSGVNLSTIRSSKEQLGNGGEASGPVSFMRGADASAGTIKSGGKTRRAAKMVILNVDHPDVRDFIWCKAREEHKARVLRDAGFDMDLDGRDAVSIQYQNANNSVRVTDDLMRAYEADGSFDLKAVLDGSTMETVRARDLMREIAQAAWECADPGMQYDTTINDWHTTPESGRINASNPCCFVGDTLVDTDEGPVRFELLAKRSEAGETLPAARSFDLGSGRVVNRPITKAWAVGDTRTLVDVHTSTGVVLRCTPEHRFLTTDAGWVEAQNLGRETALVSSDAIGHTGIDQVAMVVTVELDQPVTVYDLEVDGTHNFVVSDGILPTGLVVHNSEYMHLDNSACNLASLNLLKFLGPDGRFDVAAFKHAVEIVFLAQEIIVGNSSYPTEKITRNAKDFRQLGLGYANLGALLMALGKAYDSDGGRAWAGSITALMTGHAYRTSARVAQVTGPFAGYAKNREPMLRVMRKHRAAVDEIESSLVQPDLFEAARTAWDEAITFGEEHGYRNSQATVLAPTGCLTPDTLVTTDRGLVRLGELGDRNGSQWQDLNVTVSTDEGPRQATKFFINGEEPTRRIVTKSGYTIQGTLRHRIKVVDPETGAWVWRQLADIEPDEVVPLQLGTLVGEPRRVPLPVLDQAYWTGERGVRVPDDVTADLAELVGYYMGDGSLHAKGLRFCVADTDLDVVERLRILGKDLFGVEAAVTQQTGYQEVALHSVRLARWWQASGFAKHLPGEDHVGKGWEPHVPSAILETNDREVYAAFLRGAFEADGSTAASVPSLSTATERFADELRTALLVLGIPTTTRITTSGWGAKPIYQVRVRNLDFVPVFEAVVGFISARTSRACAATVSVQSGNRDRIFLPRSVWNELVPVGHRRRNPVQLGLRRVGGVTRALAAEIHRETGDPRLGAALGYVFEPIAANEDGGVQPTYDLSVPDNVTYVADGFVSHNTIGLLMDCDTTGIEPDLALVKTKKLVGGGSMSIVNQTVPRALRTLEYAEEHVQAITEYVAEHNSVKGAPALREEHYEVFDCAMGDSPIHYMGHIKMMAAAQPFLSGAISKCVTGETLVATSDGLVRIGSLYEGEAADTFRDEILAVASLDGLHKTDAFYYGGVRPVRRATLRSGHAVTGTPNHRLLVATKQGLQWRTLAELEVGDYVAQQYGSDLWSALPARFDKFSPSARYGNQKHVRIPAEMTEELAFLLGAFAAEGHIARPTHTVVITNSVESVLERVAAAWRSEFGVEARITREPGKCPGVVVSSKTVVEFLDHLGCGGRASNKRIPDAVLRSPRSMVLAFLQGLALDAYVTTTGMVKWAICLDAPKLLDDLQAILTNLGVVHGRISKFNPKYGKSYDEVYASGEQARRLVELVLFCEPEKAARAAKLAAMPFAQSTADVIPGITGPELYNAIPKGKSGPNGWSLRRGLTFLLDPRTKQVSRRTLERVAAIPGVELPEWLRAVLRDNLHFSPVSSVEDASQREVFDLSVPVQHAFVGNGIVNHNTVNMPESVTVQEVEHAYVEGWKLGLKALAIYRDNCKVGQPLSADRKVTTDTGAVIEVDHAPVRRRLPKQRPSRTTSFRVGDIEGYLTAGSYPDDGLGEIFVKVSKQGSTLSGVMDAFAIAVSVGLQYGVPLEALVSKFVNMIFEPNGMTDDKDIRIAQSLVDYLARRLAIDYLDVETRQALGIKTAAERTAEVNGTAEYPPPPAPPVEAAAPATEADTGRDATTAGGVQGQAPAQLPAPTAGTSAPAGGLAFTPGTAAVDAPYCSTCGVRMRPAGSCFVCESCGTTSGCS